MAKIWKLDSEEMKKVGKGALIAGAGAILAYGVEALPGIDLGGYTPIAVAILGVVANFVRKLGTTN